MANGEDLLINVDADKEMATITVVFQVILCLIFLAGFSLNALLLFAFVKRRTFRSQLSNR